MKKIIVYLTFLISFANAIQCYNGQNYVDIPESKLSDVGYTKYNITHSKFDCKIAYKRYLKIKEIEPVNVSQVIKNEKNKLKEPSKIGFFLPVFLLVIIIGIIWIIYKITHYETTNEYKILSDQYWGKVLESEHENNTNPYKTKEDTKTLEKISDKYFEKTIERNNKNIVKTNNTVNENNYDEYFKQEQDILNKHTDSINKPKSFYEQLLERPEWKKFRLQVLAEKGEKCEWCGSNKILQIHHKFYLKYPDGRHVMPWQYNINALLVLCKDCHTKAHKKYKIKSYYTSYYY